MKRIFGLDILRGWVLLVLFLTGSFVNAYAPVAEGVPAMPGVRTHAQKNGNVVHYRVVGDEFLNYMIDAEGNLLTFGEDGDIYYGNWISESNLTSNSSPDGVSSVEKVPDFVLPADYKPAGIPANASPPSESIMSPLRTPVPEFLLERAGRQMSERDAEWRESHSIKPVRRNAPDFAPSNLTLKRDLLVIYVRFEDEDNIYELEDKELSNSAIYGLVFNDASFGSVAHYYKTVTGGGVKFIPAIETYDARDDGIIRVTLPGNHKYWERGDIGGDVVRPALNKADEYIDVSAYDTNKDGSLTTDELSIMLVVHGYESSVGIANPSIWGHTGGLWADPAQLDGVSVTFYCAFGAFHSVAVPSLGIDPRPFSVGIVVHELGHLSFGFLDLYYLENRTRGITGLWSVMGQGSWGALYDEPLGSTPTGLDAYHLSTLFYPTAIVDADDLDDLQNFSLTNSSQFI
ncbi:MAG: hypothetical protein LBI74_04250, partial [Synergistaceae bacterium]|nr:hypothetical protein [Synergistaceae bacterium]